MCNLLNHSCEQLKLQIRRLCRRPLALTSRSVERGAVLIELAIAVPLLVLLTLITVDLGQVMLHYQKITQIAYEGARLASKTTGIETPTTAAFTPGRTCSYDGSALCCSVGDPYCPSVVATHQVILTRIQGLLFLEKLHVVTPNPWLITLTYYPADPAATHAKEGTIEVNIEVTYQTFFSSLGLNIPIRVSAISPYLFVIP